MVMKNGALADGGRKTLKEYDSLLFTQGFLSFVATVTSLLLLMCWLRLPFTAASQSGSSFIGATQFAKIQLADTQLLFVPYVLLPLFVGLFLAVFRPLSKLSCLPLIRKLALALVLAGVGFAPVVLYVCPKWNFGWLSTMICFVLIAAGVAATFYLWVLYLCTLNHKLLSFQLSVGIAFSAGLAIAIVCLAAMPLAVLGIQCVLLVISWVFLLNKNSDTVILKVSYELSKKRATTVRNDRWTYSIIGIDFGFALMLLANTESMKSSDFIASMSSIASAVNIGASVFLLPILLAALVIYVCRSRFDFFLEKWSKDHLSITVACPLIALCFLPPPAQIICKLFLLFAVALQIVIVISASIEFMRSFKLSPMWYLAEDALVALSIAAGMVIFMLDWLLATIAPAVVPEIAGEIGGLPLSFAVIILVNMIAQPHVEKGYYPNSSLNRVVEVPPPHSLQYERTAEPAEDTENDCSHADNSQKARWRSKVLLVGGRYNLSARQVEIVELLAKGRNAKFIGDYLFLSRATVKTHVANIYAKLGVHSRNELLDVIESSTPTE